MLSGMRTFTFLLLLLLPSLTLAASKDRFLTSSGGQLVRVTSADNVETLANASGEVAVGDAVYLASAGTVAKASASTTGQPVYGIVYEVVSATSCVVLTQGIFPAWSVGMTAGQAYYLAETAGALQTTPVLASGKLAQLVGYAVSATDLMVQPTNVRAVGTSAGNLVALDYAGKLPAVDASQLTNLPSGSIGGSVASGQVAVGSGTDTIGGSSSLTWNSGTTTLTVGGTISVGGNYSLPTTAGSSGQVLQSAGGGAASWQSVSTVDTQIFSASGTWSKPSGTSSSSMTRVVLIGGGGGGGAGRPNAAGSSNRKNGGSGGGGGALVLAEFPTSLLSSTVSVTVGEGGPGGAASSNSSTFNVGTAGGSSSFGSYVSAPGGSGGIVNGLSSNSAGGTGGTGTSSGGTGGSGSSGAATAGSVTTTEGPGGGGGGGGTSGSTTTLYAPTAGGGVTFFSTSGGAAGTSAISPVAGTAGAQVAYSGTGGGGGGASGDNTGAAGGNGGLYGGGGGGGGGGVGTSGKGGDGANGVVVVITFK
jgi:hypothetical protein